MKTFIRKYPALTTAIPLSLGIALSYYSGIDLSALPESLLIAIIAALGLSITFLYRTISKGEPFLFTYLFLLILFGIFSFQLRYNFTEDGSISTFAETNKEYKTILKGTVIERPESKDDRLRFILGDLSFEGKKYPGNVLVTVYKSRFKDEPGSKYIYGDILEIDGKLEDLPHRRNPGEFNYGEYLKLHDIDAIFTVFGYDKITLKGNDPPGFYTANILIPVKEYSIKVIDDLVGGEEGEYLKGLVIGERSNIAREVKENFVNAGVAHIIAVSGLNVAYVLIILWGILTFIPVKHTYKIFTTILLLVFYMNLTGNTPSIIRATIMASIFLLAQVIERKPNIYNVVSVAAFVILLIDPRQLFDAGFILSFTAIISIVIIYPVLDNWLNQFGWFRNADEKKFYIKAAKWIMILFAGTLAAQLGTLPITAVMFRKISLVSLVANLVAIPLSNVTLGLGFIMIITSLVSAWFASVFASVGIFLLHFQLVFIEFCAKLDYSYIETYFVDWFLFIFYYLALWQLLTLKKRNLFFKSAVFVLIIANFFVWKGVLSRTNEAELTFLDTGTSSTTLIRMPQGTGIMINTGTSTEKYTSAERNIIPYLKAKGIGSLDLLIINSLNKNEFRSLRYLIANYPVKKVVIPVFYRPLFEKESISQELNNTQVEFVTGNKLLNKNGRFRIYLYYDSLLEGSTMMANFTYGNDAFVFASPKDQFDDAINTGNVLQSNRVSVLNLKGNFDIVSADFIAGLDPKFVVIPGAIGKKRTGNEIFEKTLEKFGYTLNNTAGGGAVIFRTDGSALTKVDW